MHGTEKLSRGRGSDLVAKALQLLAEDKSILNPAVQSLGPNEANIQKGAFTEVPAVLNSAAFLEVSVTLEVECVQKIRED